MELDGFNGQFAMAHTHDDAVFRFRRDLQDSLEMCRGA